MSTNLEKGWVRVGTSKLSIVKLQEHFGKEICPYVAATRLKGKKAAAVCPLFGQPGHTHGGKLHNLDSRKHDYVQKNIKEFRWKANAASDPSEASGSIASSKSSKGSQGAGSKSTGPSLFEPSGSPSKSPAPVFGREKGGLNP